MTVEIFCHVYRSSRKENLYIYVAASEGFDRVPKELMVQFGEPERALSLLLTPEKRLAREDPVIVIENLKAKGYLLQLPPADDRFGE